MISYTSAGYSIEKRIKVVLIYRRFFFSPWCHEKSNHAVVLLHDPLLYKIGHRFYACPNLNGRQILPAYRALQPELHPALQTRGVEDVAARGHHVHPPRKYPRHAHVFFSRLDDGDLEHLAADGAVDSSRGAVAGTSFISILAAASAITTRAVLGTETNR